MSIFGGERRFKYIMNDLYLPSNNEIAPKEKWLVLPDMSYVIAICYSKVVIEFFFVLVVVRI